MNTSGSVQTVLKLLIKGFPPFEKRIIEATARTSKKRPLCLDLVAETELDTAEVVIVDGSDAVAMQWAQSHRSQLARKTVIWVDAKSDNHRHTTLNRPVLWVNLPITISRLLDDISANEILRKLSQVQAQARAQEEMQKPSRPSAQPLSPKESTKPHATAAAADTPPVRQSTAHRIKMASRGTVMVVDDSQAVRRYLHTILTQNGYFTVLAEDGEKAIMEIENHKVDCVLMDVLMPGIDGYKACREVLRNRAHRPDAVIMLTGKTSPFDKIRGKMAGCSAYLTKPVDVALLLKTLNQFVKNSKKT